jgi:1,4-dihydroxy-2-naphthoate octaprenyltransferase
MKKKMIRLLLIALLCFSSSVQASDDLQDTAKNTDNLWRTGSGAHDGSYTAISTSMLAWGIGLAIGIAVLCAVLRPSTNSNSNAH